MASDLTLRHLRRLLELDPEDATPQARQSKTPPGNHEARDHARR
jgi:hypothetical protein